MYKLLPFFLVFICLQTSAQKKELDKRMQRAENGETTFSTWADVKKRLRS